MSLSELCNTFISSSKLKDESEKNIIEFAEAPWGLGMGTTPGVPSLKPIQKFIFKSYYNIPLLNTDKTIVINDKFNEKELYRFSEEEYLHFLWNEGRINIKEVTGDRKDIRPNLLLSIGRRGMKTSTIAVLVCFETYKLLKKTCPHEYYNIMPDDEIRVSCLATSQEQSSELFRRISGQLERSDYFKKYRNKPTLGYMQLCTQRDIELYNHERASIRIVASPCTGKSSRGYNNIIVIFDELAHFFEADSSSDKSDKEIYEAVTPSVAGFKSPDGEPHGKIICISSPADRTGKFFEIYDRSMKSDCNDVLMINAPTWEVNDTLSSKYLRAKYIENPMSFMGEFGAQFSDRVTAWIENEQILRMNIIPGLKLKKQNFERLPHFMGVDVGLKNDGTAIAIVHIAKREVEGVIKSFIELDCIDVRYAKDEDKEFFQPEEMAEWIASYTDKFFIVKGIMDQYYGLAMLPILHNKGQKQIEAVQTSRDFNSRVFQNLMSKMLDGALRIPEGDERVVDGRKVTDLSLITEMLRLKATIHSKYMISVQAPEIKGMHDDESDAFARAVYLATEYMSNGGGVSGRKVEAVSTGQTYKQYYMKAKKNVSYTNRPSSSLQREMSNSRSMLNRFGGRSR